MAMPIALAVLRLTPSSNLVANRQFKVAKAETSGRPQPVADGPGRYKVQRRY
jgi:hypothetical protein